MFTPRVHVKAIRFGGSDIASYDGGDTNHDNAY